ncbi:FKBP-type peptidyl-prolyl cis-trans isomerase [Prauserella cavernicola]|uniref:Peptidyl-prolyl cis-trans isomerase n=1 Tax=Prauserella cavernicola TaxID=2800127 RepID=A0A934QXA3_9PSEU|nr:FKBP-type peptidyl-prolyl cis-trans isomerase [Prauserella cavernicola]MBK1788196.1 FKBP-type peptidyl-prolyl cis-trans isomerase [Prauserella cavernicola]
MRNAGKIMIVAAVATALAACSPSREEPTDLQPGEQPTHSPAPVSVSESAPANDSQASGQAAAECTAEDITVDTAGEQPRVEVPTDCAAPAEVVSRDLQEGAGEGAGPGDTVEVNLQVVAWSNGQVGENTFAQGQPVSVQLGEQQDIEGLSEGLTGITQGASKLFVLPPDLGYGAQSGNPLAGESLVVVAEAVSVTAAG